jgi:hypothetical protein
VIAEEESIKDKIRTQLLRHTEKLTELDETLDRFLLDSQVDRDLQIKQIYTERTHLKLKLNKTRLALENFKWKKKPKRELIDCVLESIVVTKEMVQYPLLWVGKNQVGNSAVYKKAPSNYNKWYHANVRGGGLVASDSSLDPAIAGAWALVYSKYLSTYGTTEGVVTTSVNINATSTRGTFQFEEPKYIKALVDTVSLHVRLSDSKLIVSPFKVIGSTEFRLRPTITNRFEKVYQKYNLDPSKLRNIVVLESILPYKWDLVPRK